MVSKQNQIILLAVTVGSILLLGLLILGYYSQFPQGALSMSVSDTALLKSTEVLSFC